MKKHLGCGSCCQHGSSGGKPEGKDHQPPSSTLGPGWGKGCSAFWGVFWRVVRTLLPAALVQILLIPTCKNEAQRAFRKCANLYILTEVSIYIILHLFELLQKSQLGNEPENKTPIQKTISSPHKPTGSISGWHFMEIRVLFSLKGEEPKDVENAF